jgi:DnaJ-class molecular chaperone
MKREDIQKLTMNKKEKCKHCNGNKKVAVRVFGKVIKQDCMCCNGVGYFLEKPRSNSYPQTPQS